MRVPSSYRDRKDRLDATMTPMIDVIFQLMIFFVCTASFEKLEGSLATNLSASGVIESKEKLEPPPTDLRNVIVRVEKKNGEVVWQVNGAEHTDPRQVRQMLIALAKVAREVPIILDIAGDVQLDYAIELYDWCRLAGFDKIQFAASMEGSS